MNNYKIVATDLDGTLLNNQSDISCENIEAISELFKKGAYVVPASGRSFSEMPEKLKNHPDIRYFICSNGASVYDKMNDDKKTFFIKKTALKEIFDVLKSCEVHISVRYDGKLLVESGIQTEENFKYYNLCEPHCVVVRNFSKQIENLEDYCLSNDDTEVVSIFFKNADDKIKCGEILEKNEDLLITSVDEFNLEIFDKEAGKGNALLCLADMVGADRMQTISIGDSDNDMSMIQKAGLGLATSNACDSLKQEADEIICSNEENVICFVASHYFK